MATTTPVPFETFSPELLPGERIEWAGRPDPSVIFHQEDWAAIPFSLLWGGFAIVWLLGASGIWDIFTDKPNHTFHYFGLIWGTPFVLIGQYFIWGRFLHRWWRKKRTYYALTDRRALIVECGLRGRVATTANLASLAMIGKNVRKNGIGSISFGGPVTGEWRWGRGHPPRVPTFDDVDNVESVYQVAIRMQQQSTSSGRPASRF